MKKQNPAQKIFLIGDYEESFSRSHFERVEKYFTAFGCDVINPAKDNLSGQEWSFYAKHDLKKMVDCNTVYLLTGYENSGEACFLHEIAERLGMEIVYEKNSFSCMG